MRKHLITASLVAFIAAGTALLTTGPEDPQPRATRPDSPFQRMRPTSAPGYDSEIARLERRIDATERLVKAAPRSWMRRAELVGLYLERASLTADYDDYALAERELDEALTVGTHAPELRLLRAQLSFTLHRFDRVARDLELPERIAKRRGDDATLTAIQAMRGSLAFESGDYERAEELLDAALAQHRSYDTLARLAHLHLKTCRFDSAERLLTEAENELPQTARRARAWVSLQRGLMNLDRGRYDDAMVAYQKADTVYPGWWLVEEHMAEIDALEGRTVRARERYERVVAKTGSPELMGALAGVVESSDPERAARLIAEARNIYEAQLRTFPEATYGHALDHFLELDSDASKAVALAERNEALRPNGEAKTKLAAAYAKAGRLDEARAQLDQVKATIWCTADVHATAATVAKRSGDLRAARKESARARAIDPHAAAEVAL
jgi:tetratricopeptide (TPR) repeat protein